METLDGEKIFFKLIILQVILYGKEYLYLHVYTKNTHTHGQEEGEEEYFNKEKIRTKPVN